MLFDGPSDGPHNLCSAIVVGARVVVTAAHCLDATKSYRVQLGSDEKAMGRSIAVSEVHAYPRYTGPGDDQRAGFDLAVAITAEDLGVAPMPLASDADGILDGASVDVVGFGQSDRLSGSSIGVRYRATVPVVGVCERLFGTGTESAGFCGGDSGGAVVSAGKLVGVIAFGLKPQCAPPGFATRVAPYARWVRSFIDGAGDAKCGSTCPADSVCTLTQNVDAGVDAGPPVVEEPDGCAIRPRGGDHFVALLALVFLAIRRRVAAPQHMTRSSPASRLGRARTVRQGRSRDVPRSAEG